MERALRTLVMSLRDFANKPRFPCAERQRDNRHDSEHAKRLIFERRSWQADLLIVPT
jgi:hypothetical protein